MKRVRKSILLWYSPREMYDLVIAFEQYPKFLPWCERAEVLSSEGDVVTARLHMAFAGVHHAFTTRNRYMAARSVKLELVDGPFSSFNGLWQFEPVGTEISGAGDPNACRIEFDLEYAFASRTLETVVSPVFDKVADTLVDRFVQRAEAVYGER
ncbi:MAG TPA: type II toxin-antitoxin system RatA family toxin [Burkholderiaceae bacterium]|nr:type II toxin-antitoxin system RatA family toxin [Burkholderiaceae bacterium]